jgi:class 3 adenylate cyclase
VATLGRIFKNFEKVCYHVGVEPVKTIGDAFLGVCGATAQLLDAPLRCCEMALDCLEYMSKRESLNIRIGIHTGVVISGVLDTTKIAFDIFGSTVNLASRLEHLAPPGGVLVSKATFEQTSHRYVYGPPVEYNVKGVGMVEAHLLQKRKS